MLEILDGVSHLDHGLTAEMVSLIKTAFADRDGFFIATVELPSYMGDVELALHGPSVGDAPVGEAEVSYAIRGSRRCASRMVARAKRRTRTLTIIAGPHEGKTCVLYTSFGGPSAPREPGDTTIGSWDEITASRAFWAEHALSAD